MKKNKFLVFTIVVLLSSKAFAQPYVDVVSFNYQTFSSTYKNNTNWKNKTDNYFLSFFLPKVFKNGNTLLIRLNTENIHSDFLTSPAYSYELSSISLPLGFKFITANKKWETIVIGIPKIACDFRDKVDEHDFQYGGIFLQHFVPNDKLKIKLGLYYNREAFGDFWMPLVGIDWKASERFSIYGVLPSNYRMEYTIVKNKMYAGLNFKSLTRSFRLSKTQEYDYVRYNEMQLKLFLDCFVYKKILMFAELGYSLGENPLQFNYNTKTETIQNPVYTPLKNYPVFNIGIAYRIRLDLEKKE